MTYESGSTEGVSTQLIYDKRQNHSKYVCNLESYFKSNKAPLLLYLKENCISVGIGMYYILLGPEVPRK